jgi:hypothetical protein
MAYVVARRNGRFEVRESLHTPKGPRARSLAGFDVLTDEVLVAAARRAKRPFDAQAVVASGRRAGARVPAVAGAGPGARGSSSWFLEGSRRMAVALQQSPASRRADPGAALVDLLGFADAVTVNQLPRPFEPLAFPVLARLVEERRSAASARRK